jgi:hypothetical protein
MDNPTINPNDMAVGPLTPLFPDVWYALAPNMPEAESTEVSRSAFIHQI